MYLLRLHLFHQHSILVSSDSGILILYIFVNVLMKKSFNIIIISYCICIDIYIVLQLHSMYYIILHVCTQYVFMKFVVHLFQFIYRSTGLCIINCTSPVIVITVLRLPGRDRSLVTRPPIVLFTTYKSTLLCVQYNFLFYYIQLSQVPRFPR